MGLSKAFLSKIMPVLSRNKLILAHAFLYTSDMTDSIEHNNIVALRTKEGKAIIGRLIKKHSTKEGGYHETLCLEQKPYDAHFINRRHYFICIVWTGPGSFVLQRGELRSCTKRKCFGIADYLLWMGHGFYREGF